MPRDPSMRNLPLIPWLDSLASGSRSRVLVGATGHLILSAEEEAKAAIELDLRALPELSLADPQAEILTLTGLAPGADLLFSEVAAAWLAREGRLAQRIGLLPVPIEVLWSDWLERSNTNDTARVAAMRERFDRSVQACDLIVPLWTEPEPDWSDVGIRQLQYRRLAATLAEQCDVLVAIVRSGHAGQPGGALEVVDWRRSIAAVPAQLGSGQRRHCSGWRGPDRLIMINPAVVAPDPAESGIAGVRAALREGNYLLAYDRVLKAEQLGHRSDELTYLRLLTLANAGSTEAVLRRFSQLPAALREQNEDWRALEGRLYKDMALAGGAEAQAWFQRSADCYRRAFESTGGYFSAINAATMALLAGDREQARSLARDVLAQTASLTPKNETDEYYLRVTEAEAALLLGDSAAARTALESADRLMQDNLNARGRTRKQLRLVCRAQGLAEDVIGFLSMPPVQFLAAGAASVPPTPSGRGGFLYAGISQPEELERAEQQMQDGTRLHLVLAARRQAMLDHWQATYGPEWSRRLADLIARATDTSVALGFLPDEDAWCDRYVDAMALGLSRLAAQRLGSEWDCPGTVDAAALDQSAREIGQHRTRTRVGDADFDRCFAGIIFADFAGFSRLQDGDLPLFWAKFMRAIGERLHAHRDAILLQHTWGDALHVVTGSASSAAQIACEVQACVEKLRPTLPPELARLELRLSAHYAPVFSGPNPIENEQTYFGTPLSFTARIEPVTPPGMIFVTAAFAAQITLEAADDFSLEYAGELTLAKAYGRTRLFNLRRRTRTSN